MKNLTTELSKLSKEDRDVLNKSTLDMLKSINEERAYMDRILGFNLIALLLALTIGIIFSNRWFLLAWIAAPLSYFSSFLHYRKTTSEMFLAWLHKTDSYIEEKSNATKTESETQL
jgi:hypothetical protein